MKNFRIILLIFVFVFNFCTCFANTIDINSFNELMNTTLNNGDVFNFTNNLNSDESIGNLFYNYNINFQGNHYYIDGNNSYGGFILSKDNNFSAVDIKNCKGQLYQGSNFAGAIFNSGGNTSIDDSGFSGNFVDSGTQDYGIAGAVYNLYGGTISIDSTTFQDNYTNGAGSYGGAVSNGYNDDGSAQMTIDNSTFAGNFSSADVFARGGALFNNGVASVQNSLFENNYVKGNDGPRNQPFVYGGAIDNNQEMTIDNTTFLNNYADGTSTGAAFGGAIANTKNLVISNSVFKANTVDSDGYGYGGAIYNNTGANLTISDSLLEDNKLSSSVVDGAGGAIYNEGTLTLDGVTLKDNYDSDGQLNDIYNASSGIVNFAGNGTNNVQSGISGLGVINKDGSGILNLGGNNSSFTGTFNLNDGTVHLLSGANYFNASNTTLNNNTNFNMINNDIDSVDFGSLSLNGNTNIYADMNLSTDRMDSISANSLTGNGELLVKGLNISGVPTAQNISIPFANSTLKDYVQYSTSTVATPIYDYSVSYNKSDGNFELYRNGFNPSILAGSVASQLAGYLAQIDTYKNVFSNLDMLMIMPPDAKTQFSRINKVASADKNFAYSPFVFPEERNGLWFKPYTTFESVSLKNGPKVSNVSYGSMIGVESGLSKISNGWYMIKGLYLSYNGSNQAYQGNKINNNGGILGVDTVFYKGDFFSAWTVSVGANYSDSNNSYGSENFALLNTGIAQMSGYNFRAFDSKFIIQPSMTTSYSFVNTFDYKTASNIQINTRPLNALQIEPKIKLIANFKQFVQPYLAVSFVWNIIDSAKFKANDVYLPNLSVKPFVCYGAGVQKRYGDRITGFFETMLRNGGRNGVSLQFGLRISI